jgi:hypothetical protein
MVTEVICEVMSRHHRVNEVVPRWHRVGRYLGGLGVASSMIHSMSKRFPFECAHICLFLLMYVDINSLGW